MRERGAVPMRPDWAKLIKDAVNTPGVLSAAYTQFWNYSVGNQLLALFECLSRGIEPGPINTFKGWLELGRHVRKGEKAITLCMPVMARPKDASPNSELNESVPEIGDSTADRKQAKGSRTIFVFRPHWFVLSQTEGDAYVPTEVPEWSEERALGLLKIRRVPFTHLDGNCQGYARNREVAVSPIASLLHKTLFHEIAHVVLGHTTEGAMEDHERTPRSLREAEAECVALICCESLGLPGSAECRGYLQHWLAGQEIPATNAQKILRAADAVLKDGYPALKAGDHPVVLESTN